MSIFNLKGAPRGTSCHDDYRWVYQHPIQAAVGCSGAGASSRTMVLRQ